MQIYYEGEQVSMFDQDGFYGRMSFMHFNT